MRVFLVSAVFAMATTMGPAILFPTAASASVEQCSNGLYNANHPSECAGITPGSAIGSNGGDNAGPGSADYVQHLECVVECAKP